MKKQTNESNAVGDRAKTYIFAAKALATMEVGGADGPPPPEVVEAEALKEGVGGADGPPPPEVVENAASEKETGGAAGDEEEGEEREERREGGALVELERVVRGEVGGMTVGRGGGVLGGRGRGRGRGRVVGGRGRVVG